MDRNFERCLQLVLAHEGGYVDHKRDPGGATNLGITIGTLSDWLSRPASKAEVKALKESDAAPIYRKRYWDAIEGDDLPDGLDYAVFDYAVNSGPGRAAKDLQRLVGVSVDGKIGPVTLAAVRRGNVKALINGLCDARMKFLKGLSTFSTFGKGWTSRVAGVRKDALLMAVSPAPPIPDVPTYPQPEPAPSTSKPARGRFVLIAVLLLAAVAAVAFIITRPLF